MNLRNIDVEEIIGRIDDQVESYTFQLKHERDRIVEDLRAAARACKELPESMKQLLETAEAIDITEMASDGRLLLREVTIRTNQGDRRMMVDRLDLELARGKHRIIVAVMKLPEAEISRG